MRYSDEHARIFCRLHCFGEWWLQGPRRDRAAASSAIGERSSHGDSLIRPEGDTYLALCNAELALDFLS